MTTTTNLSFGPNSFPFLRENAPIDRSMASQIRQLGQGLRALGDAFMDAGRRMEHLGGARGHHGGMDVPWNGMRPFSCPCEPPMPAHRFHSRGLTTDKDGVITTPGGYKIAPSKSNDQGWTITTPDGKTTRVSGDPHVAESDGGRWDFKRDSAFVLGDGTCINVKTTPVKNGMTVTQALEVVSGNDRVVVSGIDKGPGKTGPVMHDGLAHTLDFLGKDTFYMAGDGDDWTLGGREVTGSRDGGSTLETGGELQPLIENPMRFGGPQRWAQRLQGEIERIFDGMGPTHGDRFNPYAGNCWGGPYHRDHHRRELGQAMQDIGRMLLDLGERMQWSSQVPWRQYPI
jgi:hypothetical protein